MTLPTLETQQWMKSRQRQLGPGRSWLLLRKVEGEWNRAYQYPMILGPHTNVSGIQPLAARGLTPQPTLIRFLEEKSNAKLDIEQRIGQRRQKNSFSFPDS